MELSRQIANYLYGKPCEVYTAPFDVRLFYEADESDDTVVQPDIVVICDKEKRGTEGGRGAPASTGAAITVDGNFSATGATKFTPGGNLIVTGTSSFAAAADLDAASTIVTQFKGGVTFGAGVITIDGAHTLTLTGGNLALPAGSYVDVANTALVAGPGTLSATATGIASDSTGAIAVANAAQLEVLLPKAGAAFIVVLTNDGTLAADATVKAGTVLSIETGANLNVGTHKLVLTGTTGKLVGAGKVVAGNTSISGGENGWTSKTASTTIEIAADTLTGVGTTPKLLGGATGSSLPTISVTAPNGATGVLTVSNVELSLQESSSAGQIVLTGNGTQSAALLLKGGTGTTGKLTVGATVTNDVTVVSASTTDFRIFVGSTEAVTGAYVTKNGTAIAAALVVKAGAIDSSIA
jgi:hypothetical protein